MRLDEIVGRLRGPGGCPWDREQTLRDVSRYVLEEAAEVQDAVEDADGAPTPEVCEELGDVLMTVFLATRIAEEESAFDIGNVAAGINDKLIRRHPHVFGNSRADDPDAVLAQWEEIKAAERAAKATAEDDADGSDARDTSRLDGVPRSLPPLARARKLSTRAAKYGFDWPDPAGVLDKVREETQEIAALLENGSAPEAQRVEEELGDLLFTVVNLCRKLGHEPDRALRRAMAKFTSRFRELERRLDETEDGGLDAASAESMDRVWNEVKNECQ